MSVFAITQYDHYDHATSVKAIHATREGAEKGMEEMACEEYSRWPQDTYKIDTYKNSMCNEPCWDIRTVDGYVVETWSIREYDLIEP
jgi:hypothetical protein